MRRRSLFRVGRWVGLATTAVSLLLLTAKLLTGAAADPPPPGALHTMGAGVVLPPPGLSLEAREQLDRWLDAMPAASRRTATPEMLVVSRHDCVDRLPLERSLAEVHVAGVIADVHLTQVYRNEGTETLEVVYLFPTSTRAAVYALEMAVGERVIEAEIRELEQARAEYAEAVDDGHTAALAERVRPNLFQIVLGNVLPEDEITVDLYYTELLTARAGEYELVVPAQVRSRYGHDATLLAAALPEETIGPEEPTPFTFGAEVSLAAAVPIATVESPTHHVEPVWDDGGAVRVSVAEDRLAGNRDLVLRYRLGGEGIQGGILLFEDGDEKFFLLQVEPPEHVVSEQVLPREYLFVLDISGSMKGFPLETAKALMTDLLADLRPDDRFDLVTFQSHPNVWERESQPATEDNIARAMEMVTRQRGGGRTKLLPALERALDIPEAPDASRVVVVISDGLVEAEKEVFALIEDRAGAANVFAFGIGTSVNRHLIEGVARAGQGEPFVVLDGGEAEAAAADFRGYITAPVLRGIGVRYRTMLPYEEEPRQVADLFADRPLTVIGKYRGQAGGKIVVSGRAAEGRFRQVIDVREAVPSDDHRVLRHLWAQRRIGRLTDADRFGDGAHAEEIAELGLQYGLATEYTAFIAVDPEVRTEGRQRVAVRQVSLSDQPSRTTRTPQSAGAQRNYAAVPRAQSGVAMSKSMAESSGLLAELSTLDGGAIASQYGSQYGSGGLRSRGAGLGSGGASLGIRGRGIGSCTSIAQGASAPAMQTTEPIILGALELEEVERVVKSHLAQFRYCYQKELNRDPTLEGRIVVKFVIASDGTVSSIKVDGSSMDNAIVEECLCQRFMRLQFPTPKQGIVIVKYTLTFDPGGE